MTMMMMMLKATATTTTTSLDDGNTALLKMNAERGRARENERKPELKQLKQNHKDVIIKSTGGITKRYYLLQMRQPTELC